MIKTTTPGDSLDHILYYAQQRFLQFNLNNLYQLGRFLLPKSGKLKPTLDEFLILDKRFNKLLETDLENVRNGKYVKELLFQIPYQQYLPKIPSLFLEIGKIYFRALNNKYNDLPEEVKTEDYPTYFTRNFHWQTDGYFSYYSASLYDVSVETLFLGCADIMRRQIIPHITDHIRKNNLAEVKLLDVATGTGRIIEQIKRTIPDIKITATDISPYYLEYAQKNLTDTTGMEFVVCNAENLPFEDNEFDIVTNVYLFHELPRKVRRKVAEEIKRVLKPGGLFVMEDSAQLSDSPELERALTRFATEYHEPYYRDYIRDDLSTILTEAGFEVFADEKQFVAKVVAAIK